MASFKDHFSGHAVDYARYRPYYPDALFSYLASLTNTRDLAWDCGTGNGQAAHGLVQHFERVIATDASADQIRSAAPHERIIYRVEPAERTSIPEASIDLTLVAQALHWFDFDRFYAEVRRVLKPNGILAAVAYGGTRISPKVDPIKARFINEIVGPYWPPERRYVDEGYRTIPFPFAEITPPLLHLEALWALDDFVGYLDTWSATKRYEQRHRTSPIDLVRLDLLAAWGDPEERKVVQWPLHMRVGRNG
jgi:SAM-dependent methyltransferase